VDDVVDFRMSGRLWHVAESPLHEQSGANLDRPAQAAIKILTFSIHLSPCPLDSMFAICSQYPSRPLGMPIIPAGASPSGAPGGARRHENAAGNASMEGSWTRYADLDARSGLPARLIR
jgi:hypothetical protein